MKCDKFDMTHYVCRLLHHAYICTCYMRILKGWNSVVGMVTHYRLDDLGIKPQWGASYKVDFSHLIVGQTQHATSLCCSELRYFSPSYVDT